MNISHTTPTIHQAPALGFASKDDIGRPYAMLFERYISASGVVRARCRIVSCTTARQAKNAVKAHVYGPEVH